MSECIKHSLNYNFLVIKAKDMFQCEDDNEFIIERNMIYKSLTLEHVLDFNNKKIIIQWMFDTFAHNLINSWLNECYSELTFTGI